VPLDNIVIGIRLIRQEYVFHASLCLTAACLGELEAEQKACPFLHPEELEYASGLKHAARRESYLLGRYCAKQALLHFTQSSDGACIVVHNGVFQQPVAYVSTSPLAGVSLSHCSGLGAALAFDVRHPMGIDIELSGEECKRVIGPYLTRSEEEVFRSLPLGNNSAFRSHLDVGGKGSTRKSLEDRTYCSLRSL
jgi:4'-phosphopantetheinyl transferase